MNDVLGLELKDMHPELYAELLSLSRRAAHSGCDTPGDVRAVVQELTCDAIRQATLERTEEIVQSCTDCECGVMHMHPAAGNHPSQL